MKSFFKNILSTVIGMLIASFVSILVFIGVITLIMHGMSRGSSSGVEKNSFLDIRLRGQIVEKHRPLDFQLLGDRSIFSEDKTLGLWELTRAVEAAKKDDRIEGIVLEMRGFEAGWATLTALHDKLEEFKAGGKWIYTYGDSYDEKSYYLATASTKIFLEPHGEIEFNGLSTSQPFLKGLLDKLDVEARVFRVGKFKAAVEPLILEKMSPENRKQNEELMGDLWATFRKSVSVSQKLDEKRVDEIAAGLLAVSAEQAKSVGLIHELAFEDEFEDQLKALTIYKGKTPPKEKSIKSDDKDENELRAVSVSELLRDSKTTSSMTGKGPKKIAILFAEGEIGSGLGGRDSIGSESFREDLIEAKEDEDVAAIVVRINSPGGDALASDVIWREMMKTDEEIPIVVSMGDVAASGGYYMASAGRYVFAEPTTITGSIGVFGLMFNTQKFFKNKAAVNFDRVTTHPYADIGDSNRPMTDFEAKSIQGQVNRVYTRFIDVVQEGRGYEKREDIETIAEGRVWSGTRALDLGLVDELGGMDKAIKKAAEFAEINDYKIELFPKDTDPLMMFLERFSGDAVEVLVGKQTAARLHALNALAGPVGGALIDQTTKLKPGIYTRLLNDVNIH